MIYIHSHTHLVCIWMHSCTDTHTQDIHTHPRHTPSFVWSELLQGRGWGWVMCMCFISTGLGVWWLHVLGRNPWPPPSLGSSRGGGLTHRVIMHRQLRGWR